MIYAILLIIAVVTALARGECRTSDFKSCCCLGYNNTRFNSMQPGVYTIKHFGGVKCSSTEVYCDTTSGRGGWLVIQRRKDGSVDFDRDWVDYEDGFGDLRGEFWFGLSSMHTLTKQGQWELRIDYQLKNKTKGYLSYGTFKVGSANEQYLLTISDFSASTAKNDPFRNSGSPMYSPHSITESPFTTRDKDNDMWHENCASHSIGGSVGNKGGGWWYNLCAYIRLNTEYGNEHAIWLNGMHYSVSFVEMKIRPKNCVL
ncbi:fibrinogen-like protein A [Dysidea avara]|uniref:fibrinogen-like protein A n=1 Tax=Dysidea avara TaxID=196820 RepID=UPI003329A3FB